MFLVGGIAAVLMRIHLIEPQGALVQPETYNKLFTMHGIIMVFFFLVPSIPATLGNFLIPLMIGARDVAFPRINLLSWYIYITGRCARALCHARRAASIRAGRSTRPTAAPIRTRNVDRGGAWDFHRRLFVDPHRPELHRHHSQDARAGHDLVPPAAVRLGHVRHQPDLQFWARR